MSGVIGITVGTPLNPEKVKKETLDEISVDIAKMEKKISQDEFRMSRAEKRITNLELGLMAESYETDSTTTYTKTVPTNALPYALVDKIGGMTYTSKNLERLIDTKVTGIKIIEKNILDVSMATVWTNSSRENLSALEVERYGSGIKLVVTEQSPSSWQRGGFTLGLTKEFLGKTLTLSVGKVTYSRTTDKSIPTIGYGCCKHNDYYMGGSSNLAQGNAGQGTQMTFTIPTDADYGTYPYLRVYFYPSYGGSVEVGDYVIYEDIMVEVSPSASEYSPYKETLYPIPEEVQALDGYGEGVNDTYHNYIVWQDGSIKYIQNTFKYTCTGEESISTNNKEYVITLPYPCIDSGGTVNCVCNHYTPTTRWNLNTGNCTNHLAASYLYIRLIDDTVSTSAEAKAKLKQWYDAGTPLVVEYVLATPIETDISDLLPTDNFIEVEGNGTLTFENEYKNAAPSEIIYQVREVTA